MMVLVSYDVNTQDRQGQKRLRKIARLCENWGQRVQYSVFECLVEPAQWTALRASLIDNIDQEKDSLRFYFLAQALIDRTVLCCGHDCTSLPMVNPHL